MFYWNWTKLSDCIDIVARDICLSRLMDLSDEAIRSVHRFDRRQIYTVANDLRSLIDEQYSISASVSVLQFYSHGSSTHHIRFFNLHFSSEVGPFTFHATEIRNVDFILNSCPCLLSIASDLTLSRRIFQCLRHPSTNACNSAWLNLGERVVMLNFGRQTVSMSVES